VGEPSGGSQPQTDTTQDADVHAFLIADVRGYTAFTQERGDEDAARLMGRFAQVTRSVGTGNTQLAHFRRLLSKP
jgi:class 3 adenylate cyclase